MAKNIKISFTLDESDAAYFRNLYRRARREAAGQDPSVVIGEVRSLIASFRGAKKAPSVVTETVGTLEDLIEMLEDKDYSVPKRVADQVVAGLSYFANPSDLIPDQIPGLGFIDDAIMINWTPIARERMPRRLAEQRQKIRSEVDRRKKESKRGFSW
jgi:uncharacterized membrane protein YkvA (DUF1232 family)